MDLSYYTEQIFTHSLATYNDTETKILEAVENNDANAVYELLNKEAVAVKLKKFSFVCFLIEKVKSIKMMNLLMKHVDDSLINYYEIHSCTLLTCAINKHKSIALIKEIISSGEDINFCSGDERTPLIQALYSSKSNVSYIEQLILLGADVNKCNIESKRSPLHFCREKEMFSLLIKYGANVNAKDIHDKTILMCALESKCDIETVSELINVGARITDEDADGNSMLHYACTPESIDLLIRYGVPVNVVNNRWETPLFEAVNRYRHSKDIEVIKILLKNGADPNWLDFKLCSPLHFAFNDPVVNLLIWYGAKINIKNVDGLIPLQKILKIFSWKRHYAIIKHTLLLIEDCDYIYDYLFNNKYKDFTIKCKNELNKLKEINLVDNVTFYNFCIFKKSKFRKFMNISENIYFNDDASCTKELGKAFPIFHDVISMKYKKNEIERHRFSLARKLSRLVIINKDVDEGSEEHNFYNSSDIFNENFSEEFDHVELNYDCLYCIADYLNYTQIFNLIIASM